MRYRKLTTDGQDYTFGASEKDFYRDVPAAPGQATQTRLLLWIGEWFLDIEEGTPFMQGILGKHSKQSADATIRARIMGTQGVTGISEYESEIDPENRRLSVRALINTLYGVTTVDVQNFKNY